MTSVPQQLPALVANGLGGPDEIYDAFVRWAGDQGLQLYPAQSEALIEIVSENNVILATPTGTGKSLVALGAHFAALAEGRRSYYTAPIKALVSEKFFALCAVFGPSQVGMLTGDASVNPDAAIICCTAEVLANIALRQGAASEISVVIMDEFHFYGDPDRGWAWQVPLLELPNAQFLLMSATLGDVSFFVTDLTRRTGRATALVDSAQRPVPLHYYYARTPLHETITELVQTQQVPVYVVHFTQAAALEQAQALMSINVCTRDEKAQIAEKIGQFRFSTGFGKVLSRLVRHGIGVHHAGLLPKYRRLVEQLAQAGLLKIICGTDTLGVGINVPIRTVLFTSLAKYDGVRTRHLQAREFHQIAGRAGRAGFDTAGTVVVQAPEHEVENARLLARAGDDEKKRKRVQRKKPPEGFVSWSQATHDRLVAATPEALTSQFTVTPSVLLNVIARPGDAFEAMRRLLRDNHESRTGQRRHIRAAIAAYRSLLAAGVIERLPEPDEAGRTVRLTVDLPENFALNQPLSTFALAALELLDSDNLDSDVFALDVVSVIEATLENPRQVLAAQLNKARGEAIAAMKAEGVEYEERMARLEEVSYPQPLHDLLEGAYEIYAQGHPWLRSFDLAPKSVVRDMWERAMTFTEYVSYYGLSRTEGSLLRYLTDAYRALRSGVSAQARTDEVERITEWLGELVHQVDSSLLDEWEQLSSGADSGPAAEVVPVTRSLSRNVTAFTTLVRNAMFRRVVLAARFDVQALGELDGAAGWDADSWAGVLDEYYDEYEPLAAEQTVDAVMVREVIGTAAAARSSALFHVVRETDRWLVRQVFDDPADDHDWGISADVDLAASDDAGEPVVTVRAVGRFADQD